MNKIIQLLVLCAVFGSTQTHALSKLGEIVDPSLIVSTPGLEWVWASKCSGGCSVPDPANAPGGWRRATDAEFAFRPDVTAFDGPDGVLCATPYFDPVHDDCNRVDYAGGYVININNGKNWETLFVRSIGADSDGDGVEDQFDNCVSVPNPDQAESDSDLIGDACDICPLDAQNDGDGDGVCGDVDNCPSVLNPGQSDLDGDGVGDACSTGNNGDTDGDFWNDQLDNCQFVSNTDQHDTDGDLLGDVCDICPLDLLNDQDGDGICGDVDNCPVTPNSDQIDQDGNGFGDACDVDIDGDGVENAVDNCELIPNPDQNDLNGNGIGDACDVIIDVDTDADLVFDSVDACPDTPSDTIVDSTGCSIVQLCPCDNDWKNHGAYVSCVAATAEDFVIDDLIEGKDSGRIVSRAARSKCGK